MGASNTAIRAVLYQCDNKGEHWVIVYLQGGEKNYFTAEKEIQPMVYAVNKCHYYVFIRSAF